MLESRPQQALVKGKQRLVDRKNIVLLLPDEILDDDVKLTAAAQRIACAGDEVTSLLQTQLQRNGKRDGRRFGGLIARVFADLGEQLAIHIGFLIDLRILFAAAVDQLQQRL